MLVYHCASCGHVRQVPDEYAGRTAKCPKCGASNRIEPPAGKDDAAWAEEMVKSDLAVTPVAALAGSASSGESWSVPSRGPAFRGMTYEQGDSLIYYLRGIWVMVFLIPVLFLIVLGVALVLYVFAPTDEVTYWLILCTYGFVAGCSITALISAGLGLRRSPRR